MEQRGCSGVPERTHEPAFGFAADLESRGAAPSRGCGIVSVGTGSTSSVSAVSSGRDGGVSLRDPVEVVTGLIGCGLTPAEAATTLNNYYQALCVKPQEVVLPVSTSSSIAGSAKRVARTLAWQAEMTAMPEVPGQCYLHVVRWGRRNAYLRALGQSPNFRAFVAMLEPGDLVDEAARDFSMFRLYATDRVSVVYHIAREYAEGVRVGSVLDCVSCVLRTYPFVNANYKCSVDTAVDHMPLVGTVGISAVATVNTAPLIPGLGDFERLLGGKGSSTVSIAMSCHALLQTGECGPESVYFVPEDSGASAILPPGYMHARFEAAGEWSYDGYSVVYCDPSDMCVLVAGCLVELNQRPALFVLPPRTCVRAYVNREARSAGAVFRAPLQQGLHRSLCMRMRVHLSTLHAFLQPAAVRSSCGDTLESGGTSVWTVLARTESYLHCPSAVDVQVDGSCQVASTLHLGFDRTATTRVRLSTAYDVPTPHLYLWAYVDTALTLTDVSPDVRASDPPRIVARSDACRHERTVVRRLCSTRNPGVLEGYTLPDFSDVTCSCVERRHVDLGEPGYCYLSLIWPEARPWAARLLGPDPDIALVLRLLLWFGLQAGPLRAFVEVQPGKYHLSEDSGGGGCVYGDSGDRAYELLAHIARDEPTAVLGSVLNANQLLPTQFVDFVTPAFAILIACLSLVVAVLGLLLRVYWNTR